MLKVRKRKGVPSSCQTEIGLRCSGMEPFHKQGYPTCRTSLKKRSKVCVQRLSARHECIEPHWSLDRYLNWQTLEERWRMMTISTFHQIINIRLGIWLPPYITPSLRETTKFLQVQTRILTYQYSFYMRSTNLEFTTMSNTTNNSLIHS